MAEREFRKLVLSLSQQLVVTETDQIVYLYKLPLEYRGKQPLTVLQSMHDRDVFSATKPEGLASVMKDVNRMDLVKMVKDYSRSARQRKMQSSDKSSAAPDQSDPSFHTSLQAKLEVANIQSTITADALARALDMVKGTQLKRVEEIMQEAKTYSDKLIRQLKRAQTLYHLAIAGQGSSDEETLSQKPNMASPEQRALPEEPSPSDDDDIYSSADVPRMKEYKEGSDSDSDIYTPMYNIEAAQRDQQAQLMTGQPEKNPRPPTRPKPVKQKTEEGPGVESGPRGVPMPAFTEMINRRSSLKRTGSLKRTDSLKQTAAGRDVMSYRDEGTADYTGDSTGDYTDDSGFGDVRSLMRVPPVPRPRRDRRSEVPSTGYYKTLGTPDPVDCYMTVQRNPSDGLQSSSVGGQEECAYINVQRRQLQN